MRKIAKRIIFKKINLTVLAPNIKIKGMLWEFHKGDNDDHPSVPHGHSQDGNYKLELWNGNIYDIKTGKVEYRAKRKEIKKLYNYPGFLDFVKDCRSEYKKRNPSIMLPELEYRQYKSAYTKRFVDKKDTFVFYIKHNKV